MILNVVADDHAITLDIPDELPAQAGDFFARLDADMDGGWQMGRDWVQSPDREQRCQIVADRLYTALRQENQPLIGLLAAYLLARMPGLGAVQVNTNGEPAETRLLTG